MPILSFLAPLLSWIFRGVVVKFVVLAAVFAVVDVLLPKLIGYLAPFIGTASLSNAFAGLPAGVWYFLDMYDVSFGVPLIISAYVARFIIRRLPVIG